MTVRWTHAVAALCCAAVAGGALANQSGHKWFLNNNPSPTYYVFYYLSANRPVKGLAWSTALNTVKAGFARWNTPTVSCTSWRSTYGGTFISPAGNAAFTGNDRNNIVMFLGGPEAAWQWMYDSLTLAVTTTTFDTGSGEILDADMEINNIINGGWKAAGQGNQAVGYDLESVVTHEAGHFLGLSHTNSSSAVMGPSFAPGEVRTVLTQTDLNDVCSLYPATGVPAGQIGTACNSDGNCAGTYNVCRTAAGAAATGKICTRECNTQNCPNGYTCQASSPTGSTGSACLVQPGSTDLCHFCTSDSECTTGVCAYDDTGHRWCTASCQTAANCGAGYQCVTTTTGGSVCMPQNAHQDSCNNQDIPGFGGQCTSDAQCAPGYACDGIGTCKAIGTLGARCELSIFCNACSICIGTADEAYCRGCCSGAGAGGTCSACGNPACGGSAQCTSVTSTPDGVCMPAASESCQACSATTPCNDGMQCVAGRCHSACNPDHPGRCLACYPTSTPGQGICACSDQVVSVGAACGDQPSGDFLACQTGSFCAGSPKKCLAVCTLGDNTTCNAGQTCMVIEGRALCSSGPVAAGQRCGTSVGTCNGTSCTAGLSCYNGRCYEQCDPATPACTPNYGCVRVSPVTALCVCADQRSAVGGPCGSVGGGVFSCSNGLACIDTRCRLACDSAHPCPTGRTCDAVAGGTYCSLPLLPDGGTATGVGNCGCEIGSLAGIVPIFLVLVAIARRGNRRLRDST